MKAAAAVAALGVALLGASPAPFDKLRVTPSEIRYASVGPGTTEWPVSIAEARGFFAREGLHVTVSYAGSPQNVVNAMVGGDLDMSALATDVIVAAAGHQLPLKIVAPTLQVDPYALVTIPAITSWAQLKGKTVMVTTKQDITAITFRKMAEAQGLNADKDFTMVIGTSTTVRYAALLSGKVAGGLLVPPFDYIAQQHGMHVLAAAPQYVKNWLSNAYAVNTKWAPAHRSEVVRFIRAIRGAIAYGYAHPDDAVAILQQQTKSNPDVARHVYQAAFVQQHAFDPNERVDERSLRNVVDTVVRQGDIPAAPAIADLYDPSYALEAAR